MGNPWVKEKDCPAEVVAALPHAPVIERPHQCRPADRAADERVLIIHGDEVAAAAEQDRPGGG